MIVCYVTELFGFSAILWLIPDTDRYVFLKEKVRGIGLKNGA